MIVDTERPDVLIIEKFEGNKGKVYKCPAGVATIGIGQTRYLNGSRVKIGDRGVSKEEARFNTVLLLDNEFYVGIDRMVKVPLTTSQRHALGSFAYNVGLYAFGRSTMLKKLNAGDYKGASAQFNRWNVGGGKILAGLVKRRKAERKLFDTPSVVVTAKKVKSLLDKVLSLFV